jgi:hypothetical protein
MARQIIILETNPADGGQISVNCVFWFPVPAGQEIVKPNFVSAFKTPTTTEQTALQNGTVIEELHIYEFPTGTSAASVKANLVAFYNARVSYRASLPNVGQFYGTAYDGTAWV